MNSVIYEIRNLIRARGAVRAYVPSPQFSMSAAVLYEIRNLLRTPAGTLGGQIAFTTGLGAITHILGPSDQSLLIRGGSSQSLILGANGLSTATINANGRFRIDKAAGNTNAAFQIVNESDGKGAQLTQNGNEEAFSAQQNSANTAFSLTQTTNARAIRANKTGTGGNPCAEFVDAGTGQALLITKTGAGIACQIANSGGTHALVADAGNVGIGVTDPLSKLHVSSGAVELEEIADPAAPTSNHARLYSRDDGAGKTQLVVRFPTGAVQVIATEP